MGHWSNIIDKEYWYCMPDSYPEALDALHHQHAEEGL